MRKSLELSDQQVSISQRRVARKLALTACYQWQLTGDSFQDIYIYYQEDAEQKKQLGRADVDIFKQMVTSVMGQCTSYEKEYADFSEVPLDQLEPVVRASLLLSAFELKESIEIPFKVVVNEWVNLSKKFGGEQSHIYVNGMLSHMAKLYRPLETEHEQKPTKTKVALPDEDKSQKKPSISMLSAIDADAKPAEPKKQPRTKNKLSTPDLKAKLGLAAKKDA